MRKLLFITALTILSFSEINAQVEYKIVTSIESIVPAGAGRSRLISFSEDKDYKDFTSVRSGEKGKDA